MRLSKFGVLALVMTVAHPSLAAPVYLDCDLENSDQEKFKASITVDEDTKKITHSTERGNTFNAEGFFSANKITYQQIDLNNITRTIVVYEIDRTTLAYKHTYRLDSANESIRLSRPDLSTEFTVTGICSIAETAGRKI